MADGELPQDFDERLETAVHTAVSSALAHIDLANLQHCQEQLLEVGHKLADAQALVSVLQELSDLRKGDVKGLREQIGVLNNRVDYLESVIADLKVEADEAFGSE